MSDGFTVVLLIVFFGLLWSIESSLRKILDHVRQLDERHEMHLAARGFTSETLEELAEMESRRESTDKE